MKKHIMTFLALIVAVSCQTTQTAQTFQQTEAGNDIPVHQRPEVIKLRSEAFKKGLAAAKSGNLEEADKQLKIAADFWSFKGVESTEPRVLYNLALVQDRMGGRELSAVGYYRAYLALKPHSPKAPIMKERVETLRATAKQNMLELLRVSEKSAYEYPPNSFHRNDAFVEIASARAFLGDVSGARAIIGRLNDKGFIDRAYAKAAESLAKIRAFREAEAILANIKKPEDYYSVHAWETLGKMYAEAEALEQAIAIAERIGFIASSAEYEDREGFQYQQVRVYFDIIDKLIEKEDYQRGKALLSKVRRIHGTWKKDKYRFYQTITARLMHLGEEDEAWSFASKIPAGLKERQCSFESIGYDFKNQGKLDKARQALQELPEKAKHTCIKMYLRARIRDIEKYRNQSKEGKTEEQRRAALDKLESTLRPPGPMRYVDTREGWSLKRLSQGKATLGVMAANEWWGFAVPNGASGANQDFKKFIRKLKGAPEFVLSQAFRGVQDMIEAFHSYQKIEERQERRRRLAARM